MNRKFKCTLALVLGLPAIALWVFAYAVSILVSVPLFLPAAIGCVDRLPIERFIEFTEDTAEWLAEL